MASWQLLRVMFFFLNLCSSKSYTKMEKVKLDWSLIAYAVLESYRNSNKTKILMLLKRYVEFLLKNQSTKYNILKPFNFCLLHSQSMGNSLNGWRVQRTTWPINLPASIYPEKTVIQTDTCTSVFITALFTIARTWKQPRCPSTDEWIESCGTYIQWSITQPLKRIHLNPF